MIDIHSHILPGVDDGADDMDMALELLFQAADSGVETVVATPHCNIPDEFDNYATPEMEWLWQYLVSEAARVELPVTLCRGMEIFATPEMPALLREGRVWTLNGTKYFLTEFAFNEDPAFCDDILSQCLDAGFQPVIAHPERYYSVQDDPEIAYRWCTAGYALQLNKGSLLGRFGSDSRITAERLVDHGLAACVASDAHNPGQRSTHMGEIWSYLTEEFGEDTAYLLLEENPARILRGAPLLGYEPISFR